MPTARGIRRIKRMDTRVCLIIARAITVLIARVSIRMPKMHDVRNALTPVTARIVRASMQMVRMASVHSARMAMTVPTIRIVRIVRVTMPIMPMASFRGGGGIRDTTMLMASVRSVLIIRIVPTVRDTTMPRRAVTVRNVRTITIARHTAMPTVPCVRVIIITTPTKAVSVRNARTEAIKDVPVSIPTITEETARITTISVAVRPDMILMPSIARRSR